jgi:hypothetical protein
MKSSIVILAIFVFEMRGRAEQPPVALGASWEPTMPVNWSVVCKLMKDFLFS